MVWFFWIILRSSPPSFFPHPCPSLPFLTSFFFFSLFSLPHTLSLYPSHVIRLQNDIYFRGTTYIYLSIYLSIYIYIYIYILYQRETRILRLIIYILLLGRVFANGPGDLGSIPGRVIPKSLKMVLDTFLLNT